MSIAKASSTRRAPAKQPRNSTRKPTLPPQLRYFHRDESWLHFNERVLEEAEDPSNPLLERVKFLAITASNLDEFIEIRVASLLQRIEDGINSRSAPTRAASPRSSGSTGSA